tara:strand:+ start:4456 stop:5712 length:1257 start_codon:yes stop_codon:yes gene_type:complete
MNNIDFLSYDYPNASIGDLLAAAFHSRGLHAIDEESFFATLLPFDPDEDMSALGDKSKSLYQVSTMSLIRGCYRHEENKYLNSLLKTLPTEDASGPWGQSSLQYHRLKSDVQTKERSEEYIRKDDSRVYLATKRGPDSSWSIKFTDYLNYDKDLWQRYGHHFKKIPYEVRFDHGRDTTVITMSRNQCRTLLKVNVLAMHDPGHALFMQRDPDSGAITINDPNKDSLQAIEHEIRTGLRDIADKHVEMKRFKYPYDDTLSPGGWCQTWSLFQLECTIMGCSWIHDMLLDYFSCRFRFLDHDDENAPQLIKTFVRRFKRPEDGAGFGYALSEFVRALAARYIKFFVNEYDDADLAVVMASAHNRTRLSRAEYYVQMPAEEERILPPAPDPRAKAIEQIVSRYIRDGQHRYEANFIDMCTQ